MDRKAMTPGEESLPPQHLETFDFIAMYNNIPVTCLKRIMNELLEVVVYTRTKKQNPDGNLCTLDMHIIRTIRHL